MPVRSEQGPDLGALRQLQDFFVSNFDGCGEAFSPVCALEPFNNQLRAPDATCEKSTWYGWEMSDSVGMDVEGHWPDQPTPHALASHVLQPLLTLSRDLNLPETEILWVGIEEKR